MSFEVESSSLIHLLFMRATRTLL